MKHTIPELKALRYAVEQARMPTHGKYADYSNGDIEKEFLEAVYAVLPELLEAKKLAGKRENALNRELQRKRKVFKKAAAKALSNRKDNERTLMEKIGRLESEKIKLQQENSFVKHRSCGQKVTYNGKMAQLWAAKKNQRVYKCKFCNGWHLASKKSNLNRGEE